MKTKLQEEINKYRKSGDKVAMAAIQTVVSAIQDHENRKNKMLSEGGVLDIIEAEKAKYVEGAEAFEKIKDVKPEYARTFEDNTKAANILDAFIPEGRKNDIEVDKSEYDGIADDAISETNAQSMRDMGSVMESIKCKYGTSIDRGEMSGLVKDKLLQF